MSILSKITFELFESIFLFESECKDTAVFFNPTSILESFFTKFYSYTLFANSTLQTRIKTCYFTSFYNHCNAPFSNFYNKNT